MLTDILNNLFEWKNKLGNGHSSMKIEYNNGKINARFSNDTVEERIDVVKIVSGVLTYVEALRKIGKYDSAVITFQLEKFGETFEFVYDANIKEYLAKESDGTVWHFDAEKRIMGFDEPEEKIEPAVNDEAKDAPEEKTEEKEEQPDERCTDCRCTKDCNACAGEPQDCPDFVNDDKQMPVTDKVTERILDVTDASFAANLKNSLCENHIDCTSCRDHEGCKSDFCTKEFLTFINDHPDEFRDIVSPLRSSGKVIGVCFPVPFYDSFHSEEDWLKKEIVCTIRKNLVEKRGFSDFFIDGRLCYMLF